MPNICASCGKKIGSQDSISWLPISSNDDQPIEVKPYHFDCAMKIPLPKDEEGEIEI
jgi:hypothetical protein